MPKKKDLEEIFVEALRKNKIVHSGKIFSMGDAAILADYMFGDMIVVFMDTETGTKVSNLSKFRKAFPQYKITLVTKDCEKFMGQCWFTEIYDGKSLEVLIKKLKTN